MSADGTKLLGCAWDASNPPPKYPIGYQLGTSWGSHPNEGISAGALFFFIDANGTYTSIALHRIGTNTCYQVYAGNGRVVYQPRKGSVDMFYAYGEGGTLPISIWVLPSGVIQARGGVGPGTENMAENDDLWLASSKESFDAALEEMKRWTCESMGIAPQSASAQSGMQTPSYDISTPEGTFVHLTLQREVSLKEADEIIHSMGK